MHSLRQLTRLACRIHAAYQQRAALSRPDLHARWSHVAQRYQKLTKQQDLVHKALLHGWPLALGQHLQHFQAVLRVCQQSLLQLQTELSTPTYQAPSLQELLAELLQLETEYGPLVPGEGRLAIHTAPIVLKETWLGRFALELHWGRLLHHFDSRCFDIVALEPQPAAANDTVTHPHVKDRRLCLGAAAIPVHKALAQGRLCDAFQLIRSVLVTYNPRSVHVALDDWGGFFCGECSSACHDDDRSSCEACGQDVCTDCLVECRHCENTRCASCQSRCDVCHEPCCRNCLKVSACSRLHCCAHCVRVCPGCQNQVAVSELDPGGQRCPACRNTPARTHPASSEPAALSAIPSS